VGAEVLILDTIGELVRAYSIAEIVFLGGTLVPVGGHNILEPIWYCKPVLVGPHTEKIQDVVRGLKEVGGVIAVRDAQDLAIEVRALLADPEARDRTGRAALDLLQSHQGATERNLALLTPFLRNGAGDRPGRPT